VEVEHGRRPVAVAHRKATGEDFRGVDQAGIKDAEEALVTRKMERLAQRKSVQQQQRLLRIAATHVAPDRGAVAADAGQAFQRT
jgi:hypothetical protein